MLKASIFASKSEKIQKNTTSAWWRKAISLFIPIQKEKSHSKKIKNLSKYSSPIWFRKRPTPTKQTPGQSAQKTTQRHHTETSSVATAGTSMDVNLARCIKAAVDCPGHPLVKVAGAYAGGPQLPQFFGGVEEMWIQMDGWWWMGPALGHVFLLGFFGETFQEILGGRFTYLYHIPKMFSCSFFVEVHICDLFLQKTYHSQYGSHVESPTWFASNRIHERDLTRKKWVSVTGWLVG